MLKCNKILLRCKQVQLVVNKHVKQTNVKSKQKTIHLRKTFIGNRCIASYDGITYFYRIYGRFKKVSLKMWQQNLLKMLKSA